MPRPVSTPPALRRLARPGLSLALCLALGLVLWPAAPCGALGSCGHGSAENQSPAAGAASASPTAVPASMDCCSEAGEPCPLRAALAGRSDAPPAGSCGDGPAPCCIDGSDGGPPPGEPYPAVETRSQDRPHGDAGAPPAPATGAAARLLRPAAASLSLSGDPPAPGASPVPLYTLHSSLLN